MRVALLVSAPFDPGMRRRIQEDAHPRVDFLALADALGATLITPFGAHAKPRRGPGRVLDILQPAWAAFRRRDQFDVIISDVDRVGLALAALLKIARSPARHVVICHGKMGKSRDLGLIKRFRLDTNIHRFVCYGPAIADRVKAELGLSEERVVTVRHAADQHFWRPLPRAPERLIVSAGMLRRDYPTLAEAVRGLDVNLTIAASSPWVAGPGGAGVTDLPNNVRVVKCSYEQLRELYARSMFVAIPLQQSQAQSGSLVLYEAMAMAKPVVVTRTAGQACLNLIEDGVTGHYVPPGDAAAWRSIIRRLCDNPAEAARLGQNARAVVESRMNMDRYIEDMVRLVHSLQPATSAAAAGV